MVVDGVDVEVVDDGASLLEVLRDRVGVRSPKDGCSPQGQCGCCTVWVDGRPRVSCVTAARRVAGRRITTLDGLDPRRRSRWLEAFTEAGASQCGFCTPGIIMRLAALEERSVPVDDAAIETALLAHLCRCTGWRTVLDAARSVVGSSAGTAPGSSPRPAPAGAGGPDGGPRVAPGRAASGSPASPGRDLLAASVRASLESGGPQRVGEAVAAGQGGFADDTAPAGALVAVPDAAGGFAVGETLSEARHRAGRVPGRNSSEPLRFPLSTPPGRWAVTLETTFVEPAYLEPDASWCVPGGEPADPLANGGAFGGKLASQAAAAARQLADRYGRPVRVVYGREDVVRLGAKRPPIAAGVRPDGSGVVRVARTPGSQRLDRWADRLRAAAPGLVVEEVPVAGPPVSDALRGAGWVEGTVLLAAVDHRRRGAEGTDQPVRVTGPDGARVEATIGADGSVHLRVGAGRVLDETVLRSYCVGAAHQGLGWVRREGIAVDEHGDVLDLTIRSFGILPARDMPPVTVELDRDDVGPAVAAGSAVLAAVAAAAWLAEGLPPRWPTETGRSR